MKYLIILIALILLYSVSISGQGSGSIAFIPSYDEAGLDFNYENDYLPVTKVHIVHEADSSYIIYWDFTSIRAKNIQPLDQDYIEYRATNRYKLKGSRRYPRASSVTRPIKNPLKPKE